MPEDEFEDEGDLFDEEDLLDDEDPSDEESLEGAVRAELAMRGDPQPIPRELFSEFEAAPFSCCVACSESLDQRLYQVQKVLRGSEVVFEMAICQACAEQMCTDFSEDSLGVMQQFMARILFAASEPEGCRSCGLVLNARQNHSITGICHGQQLLLPAVCICEQCEQEVQERLSQQTRDRQGEFVRDNFPGVPADVDFSPLPTF